jgi:hypothetical protein
LVKVGQRRLAATAACRQTISRDKEGYGQVKRSKEGRREEMEVRWCKEE